MAFRQQQQRLERNAHLMLSEQEKHKARLAEQQRRVDERNERVQRSQKNLLDSKAWKELDKKLSLLKSEIKRANAEHKEDLRRADNLVELKAFRPKDKTLNVHLHLNRLERGQTLLTDIVKVKDAKEEHIDDASTCVSETCYPSPAIRKARDGKFYSRAEFVSHYGPWLGGRRWKEAAE